MELQVFLEFFGFFAIYILNIVLTIIINKKYPPFIVKNGKNLDCYIVSVCKSIDGHRYNHLFFVKRKNGKYRLKLIDSFLEWFSGLLCLSMYIFVTVILRDSILKYPKTTLLFHLFFFLLLLSIWIIVNQYSIIARIYFHKYMKKRIKGKRQLYFMEEDI